MDKMIDNQKGQKRERTDKDTKQKSVGEGARELERERERKRGADRQTDRQIHPPTLGEREREMW